MQKGKKIKLPKISLSQLNQIVFTLKEVFKISYKIDAKLLFIVLVLNSIWGLSSLPSFYLDKLLIDGIVQGIGNPNIQIVLRGVIFLLFLRVGLGFIRNAISSFLGFLRNALSRKMTDEIDVMIGEKISSLDLATIEDPDFRNRFNKIERESGRRVWRLMMPLSDIPNYIFGFFSSLVLLFFLSPFVVVGVILFSLPSLIVDKKFIKKEYELHTELSPLYRVWGWLNHYLVQNRNFMEMKILNLSTFLSTRLRKIIKEENNKMFEFEKARIKSRFLSFLPATFLELAITSWSGYLVLLQRITIGSFQMYLRAFSNAQANFTELISSFLEIYENYIYMTELVWFLNLKPVLEGKQEGGIVFDNISKIRFENVWFKY